jgi:hypothetical protein
MRRCYPRAYARARGVVQGRRFAHSPCCCGSYTTDPSRSRDSPRCGYCDPATSPSASWCSLLRAYALLLGGSRGRSTARLGVPGSALSETHLPLPAHTHTRSTRRLAWLAIRIAASDGPFRPSLDRHRRGRPADAVANRMTKISTCSLWTQTPASSGDIAGGTALGKVDRPTFFGMVHDAVVADGLRYGDGFLSPEFECNFKLWRKSQLYTIMGARCVGSSCHPRPPGIFFSLGFTANTLGSLDHVDVVGATKLSPKFKKKNHTSPPPSPCDFSLLVVAFSGGEAGGWERLVCI